MKLTELETKIIEAYRGGAEIELAWHGETRERAEKLIAPFGKAKFYGASVTNWGEVTLEDERLEVAVFYK